MKTIKASPQNYGVKRSRDNVEFIVIHYTANDGDTAEGNGKYFSRPHTPPTSAHFFIDQKGNTVKSVPLDHVAYAVGGGRQTSRGGHYYKVCTNSNSVSIELCDCKSKDPSDAQVKAVKQCIKYIHKYCKGNLTIIRHFDVNGKLCPKRMTDDKKWHKFLQRLYAI